MAKRWHRGQRIKRDARLRAIIRRAEWSARMAGCPSHIIDRLRWRFWTDLSQDWYCHGTTDWRFGKIWLDIVVDGEEEETAVHELAHAAHQQGSKDCVGDWLDEHDVVWEAWNDAIGRYYWDDPRGPRRPEA